MTPRILLSVTNPDRDSPLNYENAVRAAGGEPVTRYCSPVDLSFDGLLLAGGCDIDPSHYGRENAGSLDPDPDRDRTELALCKAYLEAGKPILGICRGHQLLNVALGGTLLQDLGEFLNRFHRRTVGSGDKTHTVRANAGSVLHSLYGEMFIVNSSHHQAVDVPGAGLVVAARSETQIVESLDLPGKPVLGVQFHPERMTGARLRPDCVDGGAIFRWFVEQCK